MPVCTALLSSPTLWSAPLSALVLTALASLPSHAQDRSVYRCPGNLYTDQITVREAAERGCKTLEGAAVTVVQTRRPEAPKAAASGSPAASGATPARSSGNEGARIDPAEQRARDTDARRILDGELRREEDRLAQLQKDLTNAATASPERQNELRAALARKEADVAAIRRELAKLGASTP
ncbi:hypothetical protein [Sphaerotilus mobilis]|uniref:DUF4124 domain-containing protein n=1 Tax=Sphaerotilus mobilis TaxID=47994 RepID=A0A4Q7LGQ6_9BURK|nr:hypothetical protein [Sphaerotilus mobilis]RZS53231.1 hypothetical protein EV685_2858 [Sphaerotilus mobilis]